MKLVINGERIATNDFRSYSTEVNCKRLDTDNLLCIWCVHNSTDGFRKVIFYKRPPPIYSAILCAPIYSEMLCDQWRF